MDRKLVVVYKSDNSDVGHSLQVLKQELFGVHPDPEFPLYIAREDLRETDTRNALVIAAGGDGTLLAASHRIRDNYSIVLGCTLSGRSRGFYSCTDLKNLRATVKAVLDKSPKFETERLPRLEAVLHTEIGNWVTCGPALNEYLIANTVAYLPSKYRIRVVNRDGEEQVEEQRSSGVLVYTRHGTSGWAENAGAERPFYEGDMGVAVREPMFDHNTVGYRMTNMIIDSQQRLFIESDMHRGYVVPDSYDEYHFNRGTKIEVRFSQFPLNLVRRVDK